MPPWKSYPNRLYAGKTNLISSGGWGGKHGENDASYGDGLVLRISDGDGALVAVHRNMTKTGDPEFLLSYSLR